MRHVRFARLYLSAIGRGRSAAVSDGEYEFILNSPQCDIHMVAKQEAALRRPGGTIGSSGNPSVQNSPPCAVVSKFELRNARSQAHRRPSLPQTDVRWGGRSPAWLLS